MSDLNQEFVPATELERAIDRIRQLEAENKKMLEWLNALAEEAGQEDWLHDKLQELPKGGE